MDLKDLLSGIAVVIDDQIEGDQDGEEDRILEIVHQLEREWNLPFCKAKQIPPKGTWPNLLQAASFILLDWKLWPNGSTELEKLNIEFVERAKDYFVPVLIFTNGDPEDIKSKLPCDIYREEMTESSFVFIQWKNELLHGDKLDLSAIEQWMRNNASVYSLKTWERVFHAAKKDLFGSMYARSPDWPRAFWKEYRADGVDPSSSLTHLINDNLRGRMRTDAFEAAILEATPADVSLEDLQEDLQGLIGEISFQGAVPANEIRCGDLFQMSEKRYLLNIRPDCDCVPRSGQPIDQVELYCIEGEAMNDEELKERYQCKLGQFEEQVNESIAFSIHERKSVRFRFRKLWIKRFVTIKDKRIGRLLPPYLTRIQQRYALYLQRQGLPRIPEAAVLSASKESATD